jgi:hypothetical protein
MNRYFSWIKIVFFSFFLWFNSINAQLCPSPEQVGLTYQIVMVVDYLLRKHNIHYWVDGGTALGVIRHGGMIPWDNDADIEILESDVPKLLAIKDEFKKYNLWLDTGTEARFMVFPINNPCDEISTWPMHLDIFVSYISGDKVRLLSTEMFYVYLKNWWLLEDIKHITRRRFGPAIVNCAQNTEGYLKRYYGQNVLFESRDSHIEDYSPALYRWPENAVPLHLLEEILASYEKESF